MGVSTTSGGTRGRRARWALLGLALLSGCTTQVGFVRAREPLEKDRIRDVHVVAVLPFRNTSSDPGAAGIMRSAIESGLHKSFRVVDRMNVRQLEMERGFNESDLVDPETRHKVRMTGADTVICGEVMKHESREQTGFENVREVVPEQSYYIDNEGRRRVRTKVRTVIVPKQYLRVQATVSVAIQVIRLTDGAVLVSHSRTMSARDQGGGTSRRNISDVQAGSEMLDELTRSAINSFLVRVVRTDVTEYRRLNKYWGDGVRAAKNGDWEIASRRFWARYLKDRDSAKTMNNIAVCIEATADNDPVRIREAIELYRRAIELDYEGLYSENLHRAEAVLEEVLRHAEPDESPSE